MRALALAAATAALVLAIPAGASADVLWDQFDTVADEFDSIILPPPYNAGSQELADDFLVSAPAGERWSISEVDVHGDITGGQPSFVRVAFYAPNGTVPADTPLAEQNQLTPSVGLDTGNFQIPLSPPVELGPGTYWVAVQAITGGTLWDWTARSGQNLHPFALRESGAHGYSCPDWTSSPDCLTGAQHTDLSFRLIGTVVGGAGPIPPIAPPPGDTTPPVLSAKAPKAESIKRGFVTVTDTTNEPATDTATGSVSLSKAAKAYKLKPATVKHAAGTVALRLKIPKRTRKAIRQAIRNRRKATANIRIVSQDAAGNRATRTLRIKLKR